MVVGENGKMTIILSLPQSFASQNPAPSSEGAFSVGAVMGVEIHPKGCGRVLMGGNEILTLKGTRQRQIASE